MPEMTFDPPQIFSRTRIRRARARSAGRFAEFDFLHRRAMADIVDRLETVTRDFDCALFSGAGALSEMLTPGCGVKSLVSADIAPARLAGGAPAIAFDEERAPLAPRKFDLIVSLLTLHAANDLVGALAQARAALKPDGLFLAALFGEETLRTLRRALYVAESEIAGGVSARIAPFAGVRDLGAALQRAGFALPVVDVDNVEVRYETPARLLRDLRGMGEAGILAERARPLTRRLLADALAEFAAAGGTERFDIVYLTGWAPDPSQQKPLLPGSAAHSLEKAVGGSA